MPPGRLRDLALCGIALAVMAVFAALQFRSLDIPWLRRLELAVLDLEIRVRGPLPPGHEVVLVMIDDRSVDMLGSWPPPRAKLAEAVALLAAAKARVIGIDVLFAASPAGQRGAIEGDAALAAAIAAAGNVVVPFTFRFAGPARESRGDFVGQHAYAKLRKSQGFGGLALEPTDVVLPVPDAVGSADLGHMLIAFDVDGAPRYDYPVIEFDLDYYPSMAVRIAQRYLGVPWSDVEVDLGRGIAIGDRFVPTDAQMRMLVNYRGAARSYETIPLWQVLEGQVTADVFRDRIVLIGADALGTRDTFPSPFTAVMPGVERLATVVDAILHGRHLARPASAWWLEVGAMLLTAVVMGLAVSRLPLSAAALVTLGIVAAFAIVAQAALSRHGTWHAVALPIVAVGLTFVALSLYRYGLLDRERRHLRRSFGRYLAPAMVERLASRQKLPELGGEQRELTILFCDLRGFTALSERLSPAALTQVVNEFLTLASEAIMAEGGTVDKYVGDAIMAFFNAPLDQRDHAARACRAALAIVARVEARNRALADPETPRLRAGVGLNTGMCTVGNFGSPQRLDYSAIGDAVNVASRIESITKDFGVPIIAGARTAAAAPRFAWLPLSSVHLRGRVGAMEVLALVGDERLASSSAFQAVAALHARWLAVHAAGDEIAASELASDLARRVPEEVAGLYGAVRHAGTHSPGGLQRDPGLGTPDT